MQLRKGPMWWGRSGCSSLRDAIKMITKETIIPRSTGCCSCWRRADLHPGDHGLGVIVNNGWGIAVSMSASSICSDFLARRVRIIIAGWASNSKYAFLAGCAARRRWCPMKSPWVIMVTVLLCAAA